MHLTTWIWLACLTASAAAAPQGILCPTPKNPVNCEYPPNVLPAHNVNMVFNGDFEHLSTYGEIAPGVPADGAFWNGAEGFTTDPGGNRYLVFEPGTRDFIFQRLSVDPMLTAYIGDLQTMVRVGDSDDEVQITVSEGTPLYSANNENFPASDPIEDNWTLEEIIGGIPYALVSVRGFRQSTQGTGTKLSPHEDGADPWGKAAIGHGKALQLTA